MRRLLVTLMLATACGSEEPRPSAGADAAVPGPAPSSPIADAGAPPTTPDGATVVQWAARSALPKAMQEVAVVALAGKVYVIGGFDDAGKVLADVAIYDPATDTWSAGTPLPRPLHHANAAVVGDRIWIAGALEGSAFTATGVTLVLDPVAAKWLERKPMPPATERGSSMTASIGKLIYVAGGLRGTAVADFSAYDTELDTWSVLPALAAARDHGGGVATGGLFYAVSGRSASLGGHTPRLDVFDPAKGTWSELAPMPTSRAGSAITLSGGRIVVIGGEGNPATATGVFPEAEAYTIATNTWSALPPMPTPRHGTGAAAIDSAIYVPGGGTRAGFGATAVVEALRF